MIGNLHLLDPVDRQVDVYPSPEPKGYTTRNGYQSGDYVPVVVDADGAIRSLFDMLRIYGDAERPAPVSERA